MAQYCFWNRQKLSPDMSRAGSPSSQENLLYKGHQSDSITSRGEDTVCKNWDFCSTKHHKNLSRTAAARDTTIEHILWEAESPGCISPLSILPLGGIPHHVGQGAGSNTGTPTAWEVPGAEPCPVGRGCCITLSSGDIGAHGFACKHYFRDSAINGCWWICVWTSALCRCLVL